MKALAPFFLSVCFIAVLGPRACEDSEQPKAVYKQALIKDVPHVRQRSDFCGEACAEMYLRKLGSSINQDVVFNCSGVDPLKGRGCVTAELAKALEKIGFEVGQVWHKVQADNATQMAEQFKAMCADLAAGVPSIVCTRFGSGPGAKEHFRLVLGYDSKSDEVIYHEPAETNGAYRRMARAQFLELWPLKYDRKQWTLVRIRLKAGKIIRPGLAEGFTDADYAQHIMQLKKKVPDGNFTVILEKPFVVIGDEPAETVRRRSVHTIKWAADMLRQDYFKNDPCEIIDIWLFRDEESYETHAREFFGQGPHTPFGYYSDEHNALVMNIGTGGGTLVHEIVHPFMRANFPGCPAWFNEGLASLYEQCREKDGHIHGLTNWRLAGLQKDIRAGKVRSFRQLTGTTDGEFYRGGAGDGYAQARYLCYYLQEKGLLVRFYHRFRAGQKTDPTGFETLREVLGEKDMDDFKKKWDEFVLKLTFP